MIRAKRIFNRRHRNKFAWAGMIGFAADGIQQVLPYLPESIPHTAILALTALAVIGGVVAHFVQPETANGN